jgi:DNA-binding FadR family transcriptional regulator
MSSSSYDLQAKLARMLDDGVWRAGERLPPERELSEQFGLARNTVRRALKALEDAGRLQRHVGRGTFVHHGNPSTSDKLAARIDLASPAEVMEVRQIFEPQAANLTAGRASIEELQAIEEAYRRSVSAKGFAEFEHWDGQLHLAIIRATRNSLLIEYCEAIGEARQQPQWYRLKQRSLTPNTRTLYDQQHGDIVAALRERDANGARAAMLRHLVSVRDHLLGT